MTESKPRARRPLYIWLNVAITVLMVLMSVGLTFVFYREYCAALNDMYGQLLQSNVQKYAQYFTEAPFQELIDAINTEEFAQVRQQAVDADDPGIIDAYLDGFSFGEYGTASELCMNAAIVLNYLEDLVPDSHFNAYIQYMEDGDTYNLLDDDGSLFSLGEAENGIETFIGYGDNEAIPPTIYYCEYGYLYTAAEPIVNDASGKAVAMLCMDMDYNSIVAKSHAFLYRSLVIVLLLTVLFVGFNLWHVHRMVVRPLGMLSRATAAFGRHDGAHRREDIIDLPLRTNNEIYDLYSEIRSMQTRILDYTDDMMRVTAEKERHKAEMDMAANIQISALPSAMPDDPRFALSASMKPAKAVGGDFYDFFFIDDDHLALVIADVSDKGVPAALYMMAAKNQLQNRALRGGMPSQILTDVNIQLCEREDGGMFVTVWLGILDLSSGELVCANAGHEYPFLRRNGDAFRMVNDSHGIALGAISMARYRDYTLRLDPGDVFFTYTDGVAEANDAEGELYGLERTEQCLNKIEDPAPGKVLEAVRDDIAAFVGDADPFDDLTMLCVMYRGGSDT